MHDSLVLTVPVVHYNNNSSKMHGLSQPEKRARAVERRLERGLEAGALRRGSYSYAEERPEG